MEVKKGYKQTEIGIIPEDWEVVPISQVTSEIFLGLTSKVAYVNNGGIPLIRATDIANGRLSFENAKNISIEQHKSLTKFRKAKRGDVLVSKSGSLGICALVNVDKDFSIYESIIVLQPKTQINSEFLLWLMRDERTQIRMIGEKVGSSVAHLNIEMFRRLAIQKPNRIDQTAIATALSDVDALIQSLEKLIVKKRAIKQGAMQELLKPKEGWVEKKFKDKGITELITCGIASTPEYVDESVGVPFLSSTNVKNGKIRWDNFKYITRDLHTQLYKNNPPLKGDILYSRVGTIGEAAIIDSDFEFSIYVSLTLIKVGNQINNIFLKHLLNSQKYKTLANNTVLMGGGVGNLNVNVVREFPIFFPDMDEQTRIATILSNMDAEIAALESKLAKYKQIKQGMMQTLLTGRIRLV
ncbi:restriction endonuclease subunit S [Desulfosporosinus sp. SB140]|uniref:restriction endonuclease subunit S n=1 Tax=Desulfosporosinus paludis TaxID=3115649 RepID=UPI00388FD6FB